MKKFKILFILLVIISILSVNSNAATVTSAVTNNNIVFPQPEANIYKEGIYKFDDSIGNKLILRLIDENNPVKMMIIAEDNFKYYFELDDKVNKVELDLKKPLGKHTTIIIGDGEVAFTFD